jgi:hypothetical protein
LVSDSITYFGSRGVTGAGDVDGDGIPDFMIGGGGSISLFLGKNIGAPGSIDASTADYTFEGPDIGSRLSPGGDLDGDGLSDIVFAPYANGPTYVFLGSSLGDTGSILFTSADYIIEGDAWSTGTIGDIDGDGQDDLHISGLHHWEGSGYRGKVYLYLTGS